LVSVHELVILLAGGLFEIVQWTFLNAWFSFLCDNLNMITYDSHESLPFVGMMDVLCSEGLTLRHRPGH